MIECRSETPEYKCNITNSIIRFHSDTTEDKGGKNDGIRPNELLEAALASCINITIRMSLKKLNLSSNNILVRVALNRDVNSVSCFKTEYNVGIKLDEKQKQILSKAIEKCSVKKTLLKKLEFINEEINQN